MKTVTFSMDILQKMPPFQERPSYDAIHGCLALTDGNEIVRIVDWIRNHPEQGHRILAVRLCAPGSSANGIGWQIDEYRLTPIQKLENGLEQAQAWRALYQARKLTQTTDPVAATHPRSRL